MASAPKTFVTFTKVYVNDLEKQHAFYRAVCGYQSESRITSTMAGLEVQELMLPRADGSPELVLIAAPGRRDFAGPGAVVAFHTDDIEAFEQRVLAAGGKVADPIRTVEYEGRMMRWAYYTDPEGGLFEALQD